MNFIKPLSLPVEKTTALLGRGLTTIKITTELLF
jgi:hypothetical protein